MRKINIFLASLLSISIFFGCNPESELDNLSTMIYFPTITLKGEQWNSVDVGTTFTDPGAVGKEGSKDVTVTATGTVDTKTPGVYTIKYTAVSGEGYSATNYRYVGVIDPAVKGVDIAGSYKRNAGAGGVATITNKGGNLFYCNNVGGIASPDPSVSVYFYYYAKGKIGVPFQLTPGNSFECKTASIKEGVSYSWVLLNSGYGTALRTFVKQ